MRHAPSFAGIFVVMIAALNPSPAAVGDETERLTSPRMRTKDTVASGTPSTAANPAPAPAPAPAATATSAPAPPPPAATPELILPDRSLTKTMALVRRSQIGSDPNVTAYLDLISAGQASDAQVNDFAAYVAKRGMPKVAIPFQQYALKLEPQNTVLWMNLGTLQRTTGDFGSAATSFKQAIAIDPINALAHYNLGAVYDAQGDYDDAIEEYRRALVLDPKLADPRTNPQVVNNENLLAVELEIYQSQAGALGLPLLQIQKAPLPTKGVADKR